MDKKNSVRGSIKITTDGLETRDEDGKIIGMPKVYVYINERAFLMNDSVQVKQFFNHFDETFPRNCGVSRNLVIDMLDQVYNSFKLDLLNDEEINLVNPIYEVFSKARKKATASWTNLDSLLESMTIDNKYAPDLEVIKSYIKTNLINQTNFTNSFLQILDLDFIKDYDDLYKALHIYEEF
ncbi:hypothetical protein SCLARK_002 [Spiroplasma clarkii]|uniref:Uncharacterized protein n=1 Tax=Spiroplasma clarkii TaxID=2139 RepID=A0A1Y0KZD6_9MOLU|nr:hypothetical protein [Spiroplasma clarkii]ARU90839.1 hypothetical protein SCLARK_002 [Spiroplasma clarkii]ATX71630.1 hypothetical protein SCLAR_v1c13320 [Spiroplasma clarkii]